MSQTNVEEMVLSEPLLLGALTVAVIVGAHYQAGLTYREFRFTHVAKCYLFAALDPWARARGRPLVRTKGDADYVETVDENARAWASTLWGPFDPHLIATAKRRRVGAGHQWAHSQFVHFHNDGTQTEVYLFANDDGTTDVYAHVEGAITDPEAHLTADQRHGDARDVYKAKMKRGRWE